MITGLRKFSAGTPTLESVCRDLDVNFRKLSTEQEVVRTANLAYYLTLDDNVMSIQADSSVGNQTIYLPAFPTGSRRRTVTKTVAANVVLIDGNGNLIYGPGGWVAGVAQAFLNARWESLTFEPTGTGWLVVAAVP